MKQNNDTYKNNNIAGTLAPNTNDWLHALLISSCSLRLDDKAIMVVVSLHLGAKLCEPHQVSMQSQ